MALPVALAVFVLAGGDDFLVHVAVEDVEHPRAFLLDRLSPRREIVGLCVRPLFGGQPVSRPWRVCAGASRLLRGTGWRWRA